MNGIELARRHYRERVAPGLTGVRHAAALLGAGSEVLGYDDQVSTDHDFGPRVQIFFPAEARTAGVKTARAATAGARTAGAAFRAWLGFDPGDGVGVPDWLLTPTQVLASVTRGAVFHDPDGELARRRAALAWYPDDVWRYALAAGWLKVSQEEAFIGRTGSTGDDLGSRIVAARLARELIRLAFLVERRWAPYGKWLGRAFTELDLAARLAPLLAGADDWREREHRICTAASIVAAATNVLGLCPPVDPAPRQFYDRDIRVVDAERFTVALCAPITDPVLRGVLDRLGRRQDRVPRLPGTIDQAVDNTDVLAEPARWRAAAAMLGLQPTPATGPAHPEESA